MPTILGIITARGGSKGIPKKNIKILGKHPLIAYSIAVAKRCKSLTDIIVSTDDLEIADIAKKYGAKVPFIRPTHLATDEVKHVPVIQHAVDNFEKQSGSKVDYIVLFQPTSPFRLPEDVESTLEALIEKRADSAVSLVEITGSHPIKAKKLVNGLVDSFFEGHPEPVGIRRQELPKAYKRSGAVYAIRRDTIMEKGELYGEKIAGHIVPAERSIDIDNYKDWLIAEYMLSNLEEKGFIFI